MTEEMRKYVGSRYVPIFGRIGDETLSWDNTKPYEPLTIVLYNGNSYTSRQFVPIGTPIENTDYWALTANYNAQIQQYRNDLDALGAKLPEGDFSSTDTVKKYVDDKDSAMQSYVNSQIANSIGSLSSSQPIFVASTDDMTDNTKIYVLTSNNHIYAYNGSAFADTLSVYSNSSNTITVERIIAPSNYSTYLPSFNADTGSGIYSFEGFSFGSTFPSNSPYSDNKYKGAGSSVLISVKQTNSTLVNQIFFDNYNVWYRMINVGTSQFPTWESSFSPSQQLIAASNYATRLPDVKNLYPNSCAMLNFAKNSTSIPANLPYSRWIWGSPCFLMCIDDYYKTMRTYIFKTERNTYFRNYNVSSASWVSGWNNIAMDDLIVSKQYSSTYYSSLTQACLDAYNSSCQCRVVVYDGEYDVLDEFETLFGDLGEMTSSNPFYRGIVLRNYSIIGFGNNNITFEYDGESTDIMEYFSLLTANLNANERVTNIEIAGLNLSASNIRYLIHDDCGTSDSKQKYTHYYHDCHFTFDNSDNTAWNAAQIIGGGLGYQGIIKIENCIFEQNTDYELTGTLSYHNNIQADSKSKIIIKDNYITKGTIVLGYYGNSTLQTDAIV